MNPYVKVIALLAILFGVAYLFHCSPRPQFTPRPKGCLCSYQDMKDELCPYCTITEIAESSELEALPIQSQED